MATREQLEKALRNADKAGDTNAARRLAAEIKSMSQAAALTPEPTAVEKFRAQPWYLQAAQAADDTARNFADTITFGQLNKLLPNPEAEAQKSEEARERAGSAKIGTDILALIAPSKIASTAVGTALPAISGSGFLPSMVRETLAGGLVGGGVAAGEGEDADTGMLQGMVGGAGGTVLGKTLSSGLGWLSKKTGLLPGILGDSVTPPKSLDEMYTAKDAAYKAVDDAGIEYNPKDIAKLAKDMQGKLRGAHMDPELHKPAAIRAKRFSERSPRSLLDLDTQRQIIDRDVSGGNGVSHMGDLMRRAIDDFVETVQPKNASNAEAQRLIKGARESNRTLQVRKGVEQAIEKGKNAGGTIAGEIGPFRQMLNKGTRGMDDEEAELLKNIVRGEGWEQGLANSAVSAATKLGSFGSGAAAGGILAGPVGAAVGGTSALIVPPLVKAGAKSYTKANIEKLVDKLGGGKKQASWLKEFLKNKMGGVGGGLLAKGNSE
jgi:hypothetical protein